MTNVKASYCVILTVALISSLALPLSAVPALGAPGSLMGNLPREDKVRNLNLAAAGVIMTWGVFNWDYFQRTPHAVNESWFGQETDEGGADKLGHLYTTYALSHLYASIFHDWSYPEKDAMRLGTLSALGTMTFMELGDSFSDYGLSYEDLLMNCLGAAAGYWLGTRPEWRRKIDLRLEYAPSLDSFEADVLTDYEHQKYLLALKGDGFDALSASPLAYLELHLGYYARGYDAYRPSSGVDNRERSVYLGLGLNVGKLIEKVWETPLFDYVQLPYSYLPLTKDLD